MFLAGISFFKNDVFHRVVQASLLMHYRLLPEEFDNTNHNLLASLLRGR
jgi:hypothetical protein